MIRLRSMHSDSQPVIHHRLMHMTTPIPTVRKGPAAVARGSQELNQRCTSSDTRYLPSGSARSSSIRHKITTAIQSGTRLIAASSVRTKAAMAHNTNTVRISVSFRARGAGSTLGAVTNVALPRRRSASVGAQW